jgi:hypothetical protein
MLARRNLLDDPAAESQLSLAQLLDAMAPAFAAARDAVTRYDQIMADVMPELKAAEQQIARLAERAAALDPGAQTEVERVRALFAETRRQALDDPVGTRADLARSVQEPLRALDQRLARVEEEHTSVHADLLRAQTRQARAARDSALDQMHVVDLGEWLSNITRTLESGEYAAARVGLQRWTAAADVAYRDEEQRQEQLGLLKALRAMAQRRRERGAMIDADMDAVALEAESVLRRRPADLARGRQLVEEYQRAVTAP